MLPIADLPSLEDPIEMLTACHDKVRRFSSLCIRVGEHVEQHGCDPDARQAAASALRYFEQAAPLHHADEECDLFPALRRLGDLALTAALDQIEQEHRYLAHLWAETAHWLTAVTQAKVRTVPKALLSTFASTYQTHARQEEERLYPHARRLAPHVLARISQAMQVRRGAPQHIE